MERSITVLEELEELLYHEWKKEELFQLREAGVTIEVYLGANDQIIEADIAKEFFQEVATVTYIKDGNHFLLTNL